LSDYQIWQNLLNQFNACGAWKGIWIFVSKSFCRAQNTTAGYLLDRARHQQEPSWSLFIRSSAGPLWSSANNDLYDARVSYDPFELSTLSPPEADITWGR